MNTLPKSITKKILGSSHKYLALRKRWSALMNSERKQQLTAAHHLLYLALCGKDWRKGFTPVTNPRKLANGAFYAWGLFRAIGTIHSKLAEPLLLEPFAGIVTQQNLEQIREILPHPTAYQHNPEDFSAIDYPFNAYSISIRDGSQEMEAQDAIA